MNKTIFGALALIYAAPVFAAESQLEEVVVTATRTPQQREGVIADVSIIDSATIERAGQSTLVELLQQQPGLEITSTGGAGQSSGIFMRGTNTNHVVVLIDGVRIQSATLGTTAFENLPIQQIDRIEILRGPASSLYGPDAIGGVIQIFTKKGIDGFRPYASLGIGSYDTKIATAGAQGRIADTSYSLNVSTSDIGGFSALDANNTALNDNDAYRNFAVSGNLAHQIVDGHEIGVQLLNSKGANRFDNAFNFTPGFSSKARMEQQSLALFSNNQITSFWSSKFRIAESRDRSKTFDEFSLIEGDIFNTRQKQITWQNDISLSVGTLTLMYDRLQDKVYSNATNFDKTKRNNEGYVASYLANISNHTIHASVREDHNSQFGNYVTGGLGYGYAFNENWRATTSYGSAFKSPTFNDLYFPFTDFGTFGSFSGNPNLKPEKSDSVEASLKFLDTSSTASLTIYQNKIRDLITNNGLPASMSINLRKVTIEGLTLAASQRWNNLEINGSADIQSPRDEQTDNLLVRRANRHGKLGIAYSWQNWRFGAEAISSSKRYNDTANNINLAGYTIFNLTSQYQINTDWSLQTRVNNVFNKNYNLSFDGDPSNNGFAYNAPGANIFVNIRYAPQ